MRYTMEMDFYRTQLEQRHALKVFVPDAAGREIVPAIIYDELGKVIIRDESRRAYVGIIEELKRRGADRVILGCAEIPILIKDRDSPIPVFDTTALNAAAAVDFALSGSFSSETSFVDRPRRRAARSQVLESRLRPGYPPFRDRKG